MVKRKLNFMLDVPLLLSRLIYTEKPVTNKVRAEMMLYDIASLVSQSASEYSGVPNPSVYVTKRDQDSP